MQPQPHYVQDIKDSITRFDERDMLFARQDLLRYFGTASPQYREYFSRHPEKEKFHQRMHSMAPLGGKNPVDAPIFRTQFSWIDQIGTESAVDGKPAKVKETFSLGQAAAKIKGVACMYGADLVGIGPLDQRWTYSHVGSTAGGHPGYLAWGAPIDLSQHNHAIALGFKMDRAYLAAAPLFPALLASAQAYALSAWVAVRLAEYIRQFGFIARAHHFSNYQVLAVPVAVDCGLGELSRAGYLLTKEYGLGLRLSVVTTNLPLVHDASRDIGVQSFCSTCLRCAQECPSGAIPTDDKVLHNGVLKWKLDEEKCYAYWHVNGTDCGICMAVCPWTKPNTPFHRLMAEAASHTGPHQRWMAQADRLVSGPHRPAASQDYLG